MNNSNAHKGRWGSGKSAVSGWQSIHRRANLYNRCREYNTDDMKLSNDPKSLKFVAALVLAGLMLFGASFNDPFHFDDTLITNDTNVTNPARWAHFLNPLHL